MLNIVLEILALNPKMVLYFIKGNTELKIQNYHFKHSFGVIKIFVRENIEDATNDA